MDGKMLAHQAARNLRARQGQRQRPTFWVGTITAVTGGRVKVRPDNATTPGDQLINYPKGASPAVNDRVVGCWVDGEPFVLAIVNP